MNTILLLSLCIVPLVYSADSICNAHGCFSPAYLAWTGDRGVHIHSQIWLGGAFAATNYEWLKEVGITHIVSMIGEPTEKAPSVEYMILKTADHPHQEMLSSILEVHNLITKLPNDSKVLVHCHAGVSRSATVVMGHLMLADELLSYDAVFALLKIKRPIVEPNPGFEKQLRQLSEHRCKPVELCKLERE